MIISPKPCSSCVFHLLDRSKQILSEPLMPDGSVVALDVRILLGVARLDMLDGNSSVLSPRQEHAADHSGLLSTRMARGWPRHSMMRSNVRVTRSAGSEKSASMPNPSRLKSSRTFSNRKPLASSIRSAMKSRDHVTFGSAGTPSSAWRRTAMIWDSVNLLFLIRTSSLTLPRKFYFRTPPKKNGGGITGAATLLQPAATVGLQGKLVGGESCNSAYRVLTEL